MEGDDVLLPLGPPLPDDAVSAKRGESGMLGGLSVPLSWGVAVPPDDYDHWAPEPEEGAESDARARRGRHRNADRSGQGRVGRVGRVERVGSRG